MGQQRQVECGWAARCQHTGHTREELLRKALDVSVWKRDEVISLQKVKDALTQQVGHDANVVAKVEAFPVVDAAIAIRQVVSRQRRKDSQFDLGCVPVLGHSPDDLDGTACLVLPVDGFDDLAKGALTELSNDFVCHSCQSGKSAGSLFQASRLTPLRQKCAWHHDVMAILIITLLIGGRPLFRSYQQYDHRQRDEG